MPNPIVFWLFSFLGLHVVPTLMVFAGLLPLFASTLTTTDPNLIYLGVAISLSGVLIEAVADE